MSEKISTSDNVYVLSFQEANQYFGDFGLKYSFFYAGCTLYALEEGTRGIRNMGLTDKMTNTLARWWMRTTDGEMARIGGSGTYTSFVADSVLKDYEIGGVRPVITLSKKQSKELLVSAQDFIDYSNIRFKIPKTLNYDLGFSK